MNIGEDDTFYIFVKSTIHAGAKVENSSNIDKLIIRIRIIDFDLREF